MSGSAWALSSTVGGGTGTTSRCAGRATAHEARTNWPNPERLQLWAVRPAQVTDMTDRQRADRIEELDQGRP